MHVPHKRTGTENIVQLTKTFLMLWTVIFYGKLSQQICSIFSENRHFSPNRRALSASSKPHGTPAQCFRQAWEPAHGRCSGTLPPAAMTRTAAGSNLQGTFQDPEKAAARRNMHNSVHADVMLFVNQTASCQPVLRLPRFAVTPSSKDSGFGSDMKLLKVFCTTKPSEIRHLELCW